MRSSLNLKFIPEDDGDDGEDQSKILAFTGKKKGSMFWGRALHFRYHQNSKILRFWLREQDIPACEFVEPLVGDINGKTRRVSTSTNGKTRKPSSSKDRSTRMRSNSNMQLEATTKLKGEIQVEKAKIGSGKQRDLLMVVATDGSAIVLKDTTVVGVSKNMTLPYVVGPSGATKAVAAIMNQQPKSLPQSNGQEREWLESLKNRYVRGEKEDSAEIVGHNLC